jgi:hypothetical protein
VPEHTPATHVWLAHAVPLVHVPLSPQVCGVLPLHCTWFGAHVPLQTPSTQVCPVHATGVPHWPSAPHVSTPLFEHFVVSTAHTPVHAPATHVWSTQPASQPVEPSEVGRTPIVSFVTSIATSTPASGIVV